MQADKDTNTGGGGVHLDEGQVHAWLDGALGSTEAAEVGRHVEACSECAAMVAEARGLIAASARILGALDDERTGVTPGATASVAAVRNSGARPRRAPVSAWQWRIAAGVLIVVGASALLLRDGDPAEFVAGSRSQPTTMGAALPDTSTDLTAESVVQPPVDPESRASGFEPARVAGSPSAAPSPDAAADAAATADRLPAERAGVPPQAAVTSPVSPAPPPAPAPDSPASAGERQARTDTAPPPRPVLTELVPAGVVQGKAAGAQQSRPAPPTADRAMMAQVSPFAEAVTPAVLRGEVRAADDRRPVAGATVHVTGAPAGVMTDSAGRFALPVSAGDTLARVYAPGFAPALLAISDSVIRDSALVLLQRDSDTPDDPGTPASPQATVLEAWLSPDAAPGDQRVAGATGCWALVGGRVPGASDGLVLRLHASYGGERTWQLLEVGADSPGADSVLVRLAGAAELRLEREGDRLAGVSRRSGPAGTPGIPVEFARVRCNDTGSR